MDVERKCDIQRGVGAEVEKEGTEQAIGVDLSPQLLQIQACASVGEGSRPHESTIVLICFWLRSSRDKKRGSILGAEHTCAT